jgi:hypothetical protein
MTNHSEYIKNCISPALQEEKSTLSALQKEFGASAELPVNVNELLQSFETMEKLIEQANADEVLNAIVRFVRGEIWMNEKTLLESIADFVEKNEGFSYNFLGLRLNVNNRTLTHIAKLEWNGMLKNGGGEDEFAERNLRAMKKITDMTKNELASDSEIETGASLGNS